MQYQRNSDKTIISEIRNLIEFQLMLMYHLSLIAIVVFTNRNECRNKLLVSHCSILIRIKINDFIDFVAQEVNQIGVF